MQDLQATAKDAESNLHHYPLVRRPAATATRHCLSTAARIPEPEPATATPTAPVDCATEKLELRVAVRRWNHCVVVDVVRLQDGALRVAEHRERAADAHNVHVLLRDFRVGDAPAVQRDVDRLHAARP